MESIATQIKKLVSDLKKLKKFDDVYIQNKKLIVIKAGIEKSIYIELIEISIEHLGYKNSYENVIYCINQLFMECGIK